MTFHHSAQNIEVEDGHVLRAELANMEGEFVEAEFDLNECIGNNNGAFQWGGGGFAGSAENISFSLEGDDMVPVLRAQLFNVEGELIDADINLGERLGNNDGAFHFDDHNAGEEEEQEEEQHEDEE